LYLSPRILESQILHVAAWAKGGVAIATGVGRRLPGTDGVGSGSVVDAGAREDSCTGWTIAVPAVPSFAKLCDPS
jgi:hypothetical protein